MAVSTFPIVLEDAFMLSPTVKHFVFRCKHQPAFDFIPGQFITLHIPGDEKILRRSYSIANVPQQDNRIEFAAGYVEGGPATTLLFNLAVGEKIEASGPYGRLVLKDDIPQRYIFVATSTGITPYRAMTDVLKHRLADDALKQVIILQGVHSREKILYPDDFLALASVSPKVTFVACLSRVDSSIALRPYERRGYVQTVFPEFGLTPETDQVYLCGNPGMIDDAFEYLKGLGFESQQIIREKYISR